MFLLMEFQRDRKWDLALFLRVDFMIGVTSTGLLTGFGPALSWSDPSADNTTYRRLVPPMAIDRKDHLRIFCRIDRFPRGGGRTAVEVVRIRLDSARTQRLPAED